MLGFDAQVLMTVSFKTCQQRTKPVIPSHSFDEKKIKRGHLKEHHDQTY